MRTIFLVVAVLSLAGCSTAAQRQAVRSRDGVQEVSAEAKACAVEVRGKPEYAPLLPHESNVDTAQFTMTQLTDDILPSPTEARLLASSYDDLAPCRTNVLHGLSQSRPDLVPIFAATYTKGAANTALLVQRKITWGEAAQHTQARVSELRQEIADADRQWRADLNASNQAELAQRQAAGATLLQWSEQQQMINAINRPVLTNCNQWGATVNCVSH